MWSPIGLNAHYCAALFDVSIRNIVAITKRMAWIEAISELWCVQHHYMNLDMFSMAYVADMTETLYNLVLL